MWFVVLGSGSWGNLVLVSSFDIWILIDCGFLLCEIIKCLVCLGLSFVQLDVILVMYEYVDYIYGVELLVWYY